MMQNGWTPLQYASRAGSAVAVELLLKNKANLRHKNQVCIMGSMFEGEQNMCYGISISVVLETEGCGMVLSFYGFSMGRIYCLKAVMLQCKYMYFW